MFKPCLKTQCLKEVIPIFEAMFTLCLKTCLTDVCCVFENTTLSCLDTYLTHVGVQLNTVIDWFKTHWDQLHIISKGKNDCKCI